VINIAAAVKHVHCGYGKAGTASLENGMETIRSGPVRTRGGRQWVWRNVVVAAQCVKCNASNHLHFYFLSCTSSAHAHLAGIDHPHQFRIDHEL